MTQRSASILAHLATVVTLRQTQSGDPDLAQRVVAVKSYQGRRFERTYADWIANPRAERACRFFLDELYGAKDFSRRDAEFGRVVPTLTRLFPDELSATIESLGALHALSESLDHAMATHTPNTDIEAIQYIEAWQATGQPIRRDQQIALMLKVGRALVMHTRRPMLKRMLKMMRAPAAAAGLATLQSFLEEGFESFASLPDADAFLQSVHDQETGLCRRLFELQATDAPAALLATRKQASSLDPLGQLP